MTGDFSRTTFRRQHQFSRVLMQQGRVLLDADWNEQTSILLHYIRTLASDLLGPHGGPGDGFQVVCDEDLDCDFFIEWGHYYVDGFLCENLPVASCPPGDEPERRTYTTQPSLPIATDGEDEAALEEDTSYLIYLDVWERHLSHLQAGTIREVALGGPDTASRARIVWQVRAAPLPKDIPTTVSCEELLDRVIENGIRCLSARARVEATSEDPCVLPPGSRYRGAENQLYRVEIHDPGPASGEKGATFKWSRDNGSVEFGIRSLQGQTAVLDTLGPDEHRTLHEGDWVEVVDDISDLRFSPRPLLRVDRIDRVDFRVTLHVPEGMEMPVFTEASTTSPLLRRWDQESAARPVREGGWIDLEDGVQIQFSPDGRYRAGDYWLIPARTETGDVIWPAEDGPDGDRVPTPQAPDGIYHHVAPLARITVGDGGNVSCDAVCRCTWEPLADCPDGELVDEGSEATVTRVDAVVFPEEGTAVLSDSAREQAVVNAGRIREQLEADTTRRVAVAGYVTPNEAENISNPAEVAEERAEVVRRLYSERIEPDRITSYGAGMDEGSNPRPRADTFVITPATGGARDRALRVLDRIDNIGSNRAVTLLDAGLTRPKTVGETSVTGLRSLLGVGEDTAKTIRESALVLAEERS